MKYSAEFLDSSIITRAWYDDETSEMTIQFLNGREYTYKDVLYNTYDDLSKSPSPGKWFAQIKKDLELK